MPSSVLVTEVSGEFSVPTLNCGVTPSAGQTTWVGIGGAGAGTGDLLQTGVQTDCVSGVQTDLAGWWEEFPEYYSVNFIGMAVSPGDELEATVYAGNSGTAWETCLDDLTTGVSGIMVTGEGWGLGTSSCSGTFFEQGSTASVTYAGGYSAEWIEEDYGSGSSGSLVPLADFGTISFGSLTTSLSSWSLSQAEQTAIAQDGVLLAVPSAPDPTGDGFSVTYSGPGAAAGVDRGSPLRSSSRFGAIEPLEVTNEPRGPMRRAEGLRSPIAGVAAQDRR